MAYHGPWENVGQQNGGGGGGGGGQNGGGGGGGGGGGIGSQEGGGLPFDANLERQLAEYQRVASTAGADATYAKEHEFSNTFDPNNPFSSQALLKRSLAQAHAGTMLSIGGSGHAYSGALEKAQQNVAFEGQQAQDALLRQYLDRIHGIDTGLRDTVAASQFGSDQAIWESVQAAASDLDSTIPYVRPRRRHHGGGGGGN